MSWFWESDEEKLARIVQEFPERFAQIQKRWAKFKLGLEHGLFTQSERRQIIENYAEFPETWEIIRPNWTHSETGMVSPHQLQFANKVDAWTEKLTSELGEQQRNQGIGQIGLLPILVAGIWIAGTLIAGGAVTALVTWALAYFKEEENNGKLIDGVVEGRFSEETLAARYKQEESRGFFGDIESLVKTLGTTIAVGAGLALFWPKLQPTIKGMFTK